jgi:hypothetical protein
MKRGDGSVSRGDHLLPAFAAWASAAPPDGLPRRLYAEALYLFGRFEEARQVLLALAAVPDGPDVADDLARVEQRMRMAGLQEPKVTFAP